MGSENIIEKESEYLYDVILKFEEAVATYYNVITQAPNLTESMCGLIWLKEVERKIRELEEILIVKQGPSKYIREKKIRKINNKKE